MANKDIPRGFSPMAETSGSDYIGKTSAYVIAAADTTPIGRGDLVKRTGEMATVDGQSYPVVTRAAAADVRLEGAVVGFEIDPDGFSTFRTSGAKSADRICFLPDAPYIEYEAQADGNIPDASAGLNANIIVGDADASTGQSIMEIDSGTTTAPAATATLQVRLVRRSRSVKNESGANAVWVVRINQHASRDTTGL
jgi:hypothetical protein